MTPPRLTFFCELEPESLQAIFDQQMISDLLAFRAGVSLGILDLSEQRAEVVRRLNQAGIPVTAWLLLPKEQGYRFNIDNASDAIHFYLAFQEWTARFGLCWTGVGLDIEPGLQEMSMLAANWMRLLPKVLKRSLEGKRFRNGQKAFGELVALIHTDGYPVESYQFPIVADERRVHSALLRRATGLVDLKVDREVWMLYSSYFRPNGAGLLGSYAPEAQAIALGSTGGGMQPGIGDQRPLNWDEFARDLRLAWYWKNDIYIYSLEGCVRQGFFERLKNFAWDQPILIPEESIARVDGMRWTFSSALWMVTHLLLLTAVTFGIGLAVLGIRKVVQRKQKIGL